MRLHRLEVQALQAFAGREQVDFDALGAAGLFLLHGDTGAGKTTLLDAICFAFYGRLPGARGKDARERSDHAAPALRTQVVLEATLRGERLRITRSPRQERPKRRGTGVTAEAASVLLERRDAAGWRTLATRHEEAAAELDRLLGMSREQFCQVVLLPQGEFATFLRADSDARWVLLERLFATERFGAAEELLTRRRKEATAALDTARQVVGDVAQRLCQATACEAEPAWDEEPEALAPWLQERLVGAEASLITAQSVCEEAATGRAAADAALREATERADRARRHAEAEAALARLEARRPQRDAAVAELFSARGAAGIAPLLEDGDRLAAAAHRAGRGSVAALEELGLLTGEPDRLRHRAAALRAQAGEVAALAPVEAELEERRAALAAEEARASTAGADAARAQQRLTEGPGRRERLTTAYEAAHVAVAQLPDRVAAAQEAHRRHEAATRRDRLEDELERLANHRAEAVDAAQAARERWLDVRQARLDGMAGALARQLVPGEACLVCGALEHPAPAAGAGPGADADAERAAQDAHETAEARVRRLEVHAVGIRANLAAATALAGVAGRDELAAAAGDADHARDVARRASMELDACAAAVMAFDEEQSGLGARRAAAAEAAAAATARAAAWRQELDVHRARLREALGDAPGVAARVAALRAEAEVHEAAAEALAQAASARTAADEARTRLVEAVRAAGFADLEQARSALRTPEQCSDLEERVRAWHDALAERRGLVADPELAAAAAGQAADLDGLRTGAREAAEAQARAERAHERARLDVGALRALEGQLELALTALAPVAAHAARVRELAYLVDGSAAANRKRMRLSAYVLAARLEEIAAAATVRLASMTDGRYTLEHCDAGARGHKRGGLDLRVVDGWTGQARGPATLSGGETFLASLALALGLADVVAAEAGGARLETLFVDEGFGSLDADSLDHVLDVLDRLRDGGRAVGIVSHVGELRQRIPTQLHVAKGRTGSRVHQALPA